MPKNIPSLRPRELIKLLERGGCTFYREVKEVIDCIAVILRTSEELFP